MAILESKTTLINGDQLDAQTLNDISETAAEAYKAATAAKEQADTLKNTIVQTLNSEV